MRYRYNPDCSCPRCRAHALYGPSVLITLGVLFLLDQVGHTRWMEFHSTWPALLIVIGLILFLEHNASTAGHIPRGYVPLPGAPAQGYVPTPGGPPPIPVSPQPPVPPQPPAPPSPPWPGHDDPEAHRG
jgi:hypothetical protein